MDYTSNKMEVAKNKVIMMYILKKTKKSVLFKVFLELVTSLTDINYFEFHEYFEELISEGYIQKKEKGKHNLELTPEEIAEAYKEGIIKNDLNTEESAKEKVMLYSLSENGENALDIALSMVPGIELLKIDSEFSKYYKAIREALSISAEYLPSKKTVVCRAREDDRDLVKVELYVSSVDEARNMVKNWNEKADKLYLEILNLLSEPSNRDELDQDNLTIELYLQSVKEKEEKLKAEKLRKEQLKAEKNNKKNNKKNINK
ncbi:MAG: DUF4364 family protein [Clostridium sp.]